MCDHDGRLAKTEKNMKATQIMKLTAFRRLQHDFVILASRDDTPLRNSDYLERLIEQQQKSRERLRANVRNLLILDSLGLSLVAGTAMPFDKVATFLPEIPASKEILIFLIGAAFA